MNIRLNVGLAALRFCSETQVPRSTSHVAGPCPSNSTESCDSNGGEWTTGWWFGTWLLFFHILGTITQLSFIFFRGWLNHQPDNVYMGTFSASRCGSGSEVLPRALPSRAGGCYRPWMAKVRATGSFSQFFGAKNKSTRGATATVTTVR